MAGRKQGAMGMRTIDYVVPMVFHEDEEWRKGFERAGRWYDECDLCDFVRYRSWHNEHLLVRCVKKFLPWVRTIYILLAQESQKQAWMDEEGIRVVYHKEFIPERFLPTFNSQSIEMFLKDIPELSEYFIYGNDDMFPLSMLEESDFFIDGMPCLHYIEVPFPEKPNVFHYGCRNGLNFVAKEFGRRYDNTMLKGNHGLTPMIRGTWEHLWEIGEKEILGSLSAFREPKNFNQWICPWWHYLSNQYIDKVIDSVYVNTKNPLSEILDAVFNEKSKVICVNDNEALDDYLPYCEVVNRAIEERIIR